MSHRQVVEQISDVSLPTVGSAVREFGHAINELLEGNLDLHSIATVDLPAAGPSMDGRWLIESAGANRYLVIYENGLRYKVLLTSF